MSMPDMLRSGRRLARLLDRGGYDDGACRVGSAHRNHARHDGRRVVRGVEGGGGCRGGSCHGRRAGRAAG
eukprot:2679390-Prymnesium_polylepis.1